MLFRSHKLRPAETPGELALVDLTCQRLGIPFVTATVDVPRLVAGQGRSPEEAARHLRYTELERLRAECGATFIALGHTADDQVEEFFLRLLRGAGRAMLPHNRLGRAQRREPKLEAGPDHPHGAQRPDVLEIKE